MSDQKKYLILNKRFTQEIQETVGEIYGEPLNILKSNEMYDAIEIDHLLRSFCEENEHFHKEIIHKIQGIESVSEQFILDFFEPKVMDTEVSAE